MIKPIKNISCVVSIVGAMVAMADSWVVREDVDLLTDEIAYHTYVDGTEVSGNDLICRPLLMVRLIPVGYDKETDRVTFSRDVYIWSPVFRRDDSNVADIPLKARFDKNAVFDGSLQCSDNRCAYFFDDPTNIVKQLVSSEKFVIRFVYDNKTVTTAFDSSGFRDAARKIKHDYLVTIGNVAAENSKVGDGKNTTSNQPRVCSKCGGKGVIRGWAKCRYCKILMRRCDRCRGAMRPGYVRGDIPCPKCSNQRLAYGNGERRNGLISSRDRKKDIRSNVGERMQTTRTKEDEVVEQGYYSGMKTKFSAKRLNSRETKRDD